MALNVGSDGMGSWSLDFMRPLLERTFPHTKITCDAEKPANLVIRSHFVGLERAAPYRCAYITWSGESRRVAQLPDRPPLFEVNTFHSKAEHSVYFPHLVAEVPYTVRPSSSQKSPKKYCCAYAFSNHVVKRAQLFTSMRRIEPTCYSFGRSCPTDDNPFAAPNVDRKQNADHFKDFGFNVAMENAIVPGYITEKIGFAFCSGSVPIYWGDTETVNDFFNPASFLNVRDYANAEIAGSAAVEIWRDRQKFQKFLDAPIRLNNRLADYEAIYTEYRPWQKPMVDILRDAFPDFS
jgi:hypothetical protein